MSREKLSNQSKFNSLGCLGIYSSKLKMRNLGRVKASGLIDRNRPNIRNMRSITIDQSRELSRRPKFSFRAWMSILALLLLIGCSKSNTAWEFESLKGKNHIARYTPSRKTGAFQFELLQGTFGQYGYLNVLSNEIIKSNEVVFTINSQSYKCNCALFEGGQRLLLPIEATKMIVNSLLDGQNVIVRCECYYTELEASGTSIRGSTLKAI